MSKNIRFKRGNKTKLPSSAPSGMPLWCEDTEELYIGTGNGRSKVGGESVTEAVVDQKLTDYVPKTQLATKNQAGIMKVGNNLDVTSTGQVSGVKISAGVAISVVQSYATTVTAFSNNSNLSLSINYTDTKDHAGSEMVQFYATGESIDPSKYSGVARNSKCTARYFIKNGYLFYHYNISNLDDIEQVGSSNGWTDVSGAGLTNSTHYSYGICNGELYRVYASYATKVSDLTGWTCLAGSYAYYSSSYIENGYGICSGKLYALKGDTITQVGTLTTWTKISGHYSNLSKYYAYGIAGGCLYAISNTTATKVGTLTAWTDISGGSVNDTDYQDYAYGICGGSLYALLGTSATKIGSLTGWTHISGEHSTFSNDNKQYAYGICSGYLYAIDLKTATQVGSSNQWTETIGYSVKYVTSNNQLYAYGICNGKLYALNGVDITQIGSSNGWYNLSGCQNTTSGGFGAYAICNNNLYGIKVSELYELSTCKWLSNGQYVNLSDYGIFVTGAVKAGNTITAIYLTELTSTISHTAPYIVSQTVSGAYHCRKWSNNFCEQWSQFSGSGKSGTITLPQAYIDANYVLITGEGCSGSSSDTEGIDFACLFSNLTTTSFRYSSANGRPFSWYTAGYIS